MIRLVLLLALGAGVAGGVYYLTLPDCKRSGGAADTAGVTSGAAVISSKV